VGVVHPELTNARFTRRSRRQNQRQKKPGNSGQASPFNKKWVVPKKARSGDYVIVNVGRHGLFATARIASDARPRADWKNRYGAALTAIKLIKPSISLDIVKRKIPKFVWAKYPRSITTPSVSVARQLQSLVRKRRLTKDPELRDSDLSTASLQELRAEALLSARPTAARKKHLANYFSRSRRIHAFVMARAYGYCEACAASAPFLKFDGSPYLEPHHTTRLADEGPDHPATVIALCPNCHRKAHSSQDKAAFNAKLRKKARQLWTAGDEA
jgi:hypothetical protein